MHDVRNFPPIAAPEDIDWPRPDPDHLYRRFGPEDWSRFIAELTAGAIAYVETPQPCPFCPDGTAGRR